HYVRKWDMQFAPSVCMNCSLGCNVSPGERYGDVRRIENRYNGDINHYFLCDRGRFGYGYVNRKDRPRAAFVKHGDKQEPAPDDDALAHVGGLLRGAKHAIGIGSPRASLESNYALRELVGADNFFDGHADTERELVLRAIDILRHSPAPSATLKEVESADAALVLNEDVTQTAPRIALSLRQAARGRAATLAAEKNLQAWQAEALAHLAQDERNPIFVTASHATHIDDIAAECYRAAADDQARLGFAVAHIIDSSAPQVPDLDENPQALAPRIADTLLAADNPLLVSGTGAACKAVLDATANIAAALHTRGKAVKLFLALPEANSFGLGLMQARPLGEALKALESADADVAVVLENDLYRRAAPDTVDAALAHARLVCIDHQATQTLHRAEVVLPAATVFEGDGTVINNEGRAQRYFQVFDTRYYNPEVATTESWRWLRRIKAHAQADGHDSSTLDDLTEACAHAFEALAPISRAAPEADFRIFGLKAARAPHRYSGRTAMRANLSVHEPRASHDTDSALSFSMEGFNGTGADTPRPAALIPYVGAG
ncbi:MAG: molybdopterin-dependent oxidoreductase, partial [Sinobacteraceae bacterium]|nr:molybdopterin-dependent oxidoreductase [Nevskiaceae bacterium]